MIVATVRNITRLATRGNVIASFYSAFVKVIVDFDRYTDKFVEVLDFLAGPYKFVFNIFL
jgi:hypothetical protein